MPVVSSKVSQQELDAIGEFASKYGTTVSNLIRMLLIREIGIMRVFAMMSDQTSTRAESSDEHADSSEFSEMQKLVRLGNEKSARSQ